MTCNQEKEIFTQIKVIGKRDVDDHEDSDLSGSIDSSEIETQVVRDQWNSKTEFLFSCISYSIGLGNLWRFPYKCYENGGGAFLIPYLVFLIIAGMPMYFMELSMGQFCSQGPFGVWHISRLFIGLGYAMVAISFFCSIYYNVIVAWILHYLFYSFKALIFQENLPWVIDGCDKKNLNASQSEACGHASENYWNKEVLQKTENLDDFGGFQTELLIAFVFAWIFVGLFLIKGVKSSGKVTYFTACFPYVVILALLIRGLTLPGAAEGLKFYLLPEWSKLLDPNVWNTAASQIFYSLGLAFGSLITLASYSPFKNNVLRMTFIVTTVNCSTSIIAGIVIFAVIGHLAHETGTSVQDVVASGPGLAFVVYPDAVSQMPLSAFWAFLFFFMMLNLGFGSQLALVETVITAFTDRIPKLLPYKWLVCICVCVVMFLLGLPMVTRSGMHWLNLMDTYSCSYSLFVISFIEISALVYIYGGKKILVQIEAMLGKKVLISNWWRFTWGVTTPLAIFVIFIFNMVYYKPMMYENGRPIPVWAEGIGWCTALGSVIFIPGCALFEFCRAKGSFYERVESLLRPDEFYRPYENSDLSLVNELFERENMDKLCSSKHCETVYKSHTGIDVAITAGGSLDTFA